MITGYREESRLNGGKITGKMIGLEMVAHGDKVEDTVRRHQENKLIGFGD